MIRCETAPTDLKVMEFANEDMFSETISSKLFCKAWLFVSAVVSNVHGAMVARQLIQRFCHANLCLEVNCNCLITVASQI